MSSHTITLFTAPPPPGRGLSSFAVSMLMHGVALCMVSVALRHTTYVIENRINERYSLRLLEVHSLQPQMRSSDESSITYPGLHALTGAAQPGGRSAAPSSVPRRLAHLVSAPQTLVQPDLPPNVVLPPDTPIPAALLWSSVNSHVKKINPPPQQVTATADVPPTFDPPNHELNLADLKISGTSYATVTPAPPPSTTSPIVVHGHQPVQRVPQMASSSSEPPTPASVMSISDLQMRDGIIALPPVNQTAPASSSGALVIGHGENGQQAGSGDSASNTEEKGTTAMGSAPKIHANAGANQASGVIPLADTGNRSLVSRINLPKNGRFGAVVVGSSLAEAYPETLGVWGDRLAYTVYVHAGLARNWILQYSMPRSAEAATAGDVVRPDPPWPFYIVVPHIAADDVNADALMIHGFVNAAGRFEQLGVVSPPDFAQSEFVLNTLEEWKFRPAVQNGQVTTVEVLLIIPEDPD